MHLNISTKASIKIALGVSARDGRTVLFYRTHTHATDKLFSLTSLDGVTFLGDGQPLTIRGKSGLPLTFKTLSRIGASFANNQYHITLSYTRGKKQYHSLAAGFDLTHYKVVGELPDLGQSSLVSDYTFKGHLVAFVGGKSIVLATSPNGTLWTAGKKALISPSRQGATLIPTLSHSTANGVMLLYYEVDGDEGGKPFYTIRAALFDTNNPAKLTWRSSHPLWEQPHDWNQRAFSNRHVGLVVVNGRLLSFWENEESVLFAILHMPARSLHQDMPARPRPKLDKHTHNPILTPIAGHFWESKATFNPAAIFTQGKVHIIYRAIGEADTSMLGYASSQDGVHIDERLADPVYVPTQPFEYTGLRTSSPQTPFASGGGVYGGAEDPRLTKIGDTLYMTYVAYNGSHPPRVALTSIALSDFLEKNWNWATPVIISPPAVVDKNAVIFPEQIDGKYVLMHRIFPNILIDFVDSLDFDGRTFLRGEYAISPTRTSWDSRKIGAGAPPLATDVGWLLIYHAVDELDSGRYKMGAMILDKRDPTRVIARTTHPILEPTHAYENEGYKSGVAYPCGAVTIDDTLYVYYGGADTVSCVASAPLSSFLHDLLNQHSVRFARVEQIR